MVDMLRPSRWRRAFTTPLSSLYRFVQLHACDAAVQPAEGPRPCVGSVRPGPGLRTRDPAVALLQRPRCEKRRRLISNILSWILTRAEEIISPAKQFNWLQVFISSLIFSYLYGCFVFSLQGISIKPNHQLYGNLCIMLQRPKYIL